MKSINLINCVDIRLQSVVTYTYIGNMTYLFGSDTIKSFLNKLNLKSYSDYIYSRIIRYSDFQNRTVQFLRLRLLAYISSILALWNLLVFFHASKYRGSSNLRV
jgi:hypothetical protein